MAACGADGSGLAAARALPLQRRYRRSAATAPTGNPNVSIQGATGPARVRAPAANRMLIGLNPTSPVAQLMLNAPIPSRDARTQRQRLGIWRRVAIQHAVERDVAAARIVRSSHR